MTHTNKPDSSYINLPSMWVGDFWSKPPLPPFFKSSQLVSQVSKSFAQLNSSLGLQVVQVWDIRTFLSTQKTNMPNISGYQKSHQSEVIRDILTVHSCDFRTNFDPRNFGGDFRHLGTSHMHLPWQVGETLNP